MILLHRNENLLAKIKHLVPVLIQPFQLSGLNSCSADDCDVAHSEKLVSCGGTFSTAASLAAWIGKQSTYSSSLVSRSWFITALSQCFFDENKHNTSAAVGESKSSLSSSSAAAASLEEAEFSNTDFQTRLLESDSVVIDLDACRVVSRRASVVMDSFMFRRWNSCDAYRKLHHAVHKQLPKSQTLQDRNQHLEQLVRSFWNETFLRLLPSNLLYFPSHRILACDVQRLLMTLYIDKSRGSQALSASLRQLGIKEQHGHINATSSHFYVHGKKEELINDIRNKVSAMGDKRNSNQHSSNNNYNNFSIHPKCNNGNNSGLLFDDPETWFCCELVGSTLPAFTDLLMRHGRMIESFQF